LGAVKLAAAGDTAQGWAYRCFPCMIFVAERSADAQSTVLPGKVRASGSRKIPPLTRGRLSSRVFRVKRWHDGDRWERRGACFFLRSITAMKMVMSDLDWQLGPHPAGKARLWYEEKHANRWIKAQKRGGLRSNNL